MGSWEFQRSLAFHSLSKMYLELIDSSREFLAAAVVGCSNWIETNTHQNSECTNQEHRLTPPKVQIDGCGVRYFALDQITTIVLPSIYLNIYTLHTLSALPQILETQRNATQRNAAQHNNHVRIKSHARPANARQRFAEQ